MGSAFGRGLLYANVQNEQLWQMKMEAHFGIQTFTVTTYN